MNKFSELQFKPLSHITGVQCIKQFDNGYSASIVRGPHTYGGKDGLYELAVIHNNQIVYDTPITSDVCGYLTPEEVESTLNDIEKLPQRI